MKIIKLQDNILRRIRFKGLWTPEHLDLFLDHRLMEAIIFQMLKPFKKDKIDKVVALDSVGFIFGALIANKLKVGLVLIRKEGTISSLSYKTTFIDYSKQKKILEIKKAYSIRRGDKLLIVDDWAETGMHLIQAIKLLRKFRPKIIGISLLVNEMNEKQRKALSKYKAREIIDFNKTQRPNW